LSIFFGQAFVMNFVGTSNGFGVFGIGSSKPFDTLVDKNIMHKEISEPISKNA